MSKNMKLFLDLDGTIIDVSERYYRIYTEILGDIGTSTLSKDEYWELKRQQLLEYNILLKTCMPIQIDMYLKRRKGLIEDPDFLAVDTLIDGAKGVLEAVAESHDLYLVTLRKDRSALMDQLEALDIKKYFNEIISGYSSVDPSQTKEAMIRDNCNVDTTDLIVGDTEADIRSGKALGIRTCAVTSGIRSTELLEIETPDHIINSINDLTRIL